MGDQLQYMVEGKLEPNGYQQITTLTSAQSLKVPKGARVALLQAVGQNIRWLDNGFNPTASLGAQLVPGKDKLYTGDLARIRFIEETASAELNVTYRGLAPSVSDTPTTIFGTDLVGWWNVQRAATVISGNVSMVADLTGNGNDLTQTTEANRPPYAAAAINGRAAIAYDKTAGQSLAGPGALNASTSWTLFFTFGGYTEISFTNFLTMDATPTNMRFQIKSDTGGIRIDATTTITNLSTLGGVPWVGTDTFSVIISALAGDPGDYHVWFKRNDSTPDQSATEDQYIDDDAHALELHTVGAGNGVLDVGEIGMINRAISQNDLTEANALGNYMAREWGHTQNWALN